MYIYVFIYIYACEDPALGGVWGTINIQYMHHANQPFSNYMHKMKKLIMVAAATMGVENKVKWRVNFCLHCAAHICAPPHRFICCLYKRVFICSSLKFCVFWLVVDFFFVVFKGSLLNK